MFLLNGFFMHCASYCQIIVMFKIYEETRDENCNKNKKKENETGWDLEKKY